MEILASLLLKFPYFIFCGSILEVVINSTEGDLMSLILVQLNVFIVLKNSIFGMIMPYLVSYLIYVSLKFPLVLNRLF